MWVVWAVTTVLTMCMISGDAQKIQEIKLFDVVNLTEAGVNETQGYHSNSKAYEFTDVTGPLIANETVSAKFATQAFLFNDYTVSAYLQTPSGSTGGTIVFFSRGTKAGAAFNIVFRWSDPRTIAISAGFYIKNTGLSYVCRITDMDSYRTDWLHLTVRVHILERLIRCNIETKDQKKASSYAGRQTGGAIDKFPIDGKLRLAQQLLSGAEHLINIQDRFVGKLQDVVISFGNPNCTIIIPDKPTQPMTTTSSGSTPTCPPTQKVPVEDNKCVDSLGKLHADGQNWEEGKFVKCSCNKRRSYCVKSVKRCLYQGTEYPEGYMWDDLKSCDKCKCENGISKCESTEREYQDDGCPFTCSDNQSGSCPHAKYKGCFCPKKKPVLLNGVCVDSLNCPCVDKGGKHYPVGLKMETLSRGCFKFCNCLDRKLSCSENC